MGKVLRTQAVTFGQYKVPMALIDLFRYAADDSGFSNLETRKQLAVVKECLTNELTTYRAV